MSNIDESLQLYWTSVKFFRRTGKAVWRKNLEALALRPETPAGREALKFLLIRQNSNGNKSDSC